MRLRVGACLSLSGKYARFGAMAASGLRAWAEMRQDVGLAVEDDRSDGTLVRAGLARLAGSCDVLLGPYSTALTREAGKVAAEAGLLVWNHGGAGDDVQAMAPGHMVSVLTPARRYAEPFLRRLAQESAQRPLLLRAGRGRFAQQVIAGAASEARRLGITTLVVAEQGDWRSPDLLAGWDLLSAGSFEEDLDTVRLARGLRRPPRHICTVAAGVREFGQATGDALGVHGLAQWFPGAATTPDTGPTEPDFITAYESMGSGPPDYPAVQAAVAAELAVHCCEIAESTRPEMVWPVVSRLKARTLYGWFGIDAESGFQTAHETTLVRWADGGLERVS